MKRILPFLSLLVVIGWACQQEPEDIFSGNNQNNTSDSTLLIKYVYLDTTESAPLDTSTYDVFLYDSQKRLVNWYKIDNYGSYVDTIRIGRYYYHGDDTMPYKRVRLLPNPDGELTSTDTAFYVYDNMDRLTGYSLTIVDRFNGQQHFFSTNNLYTYTSYGLNIMAVEESYDIPAVLPPEKRYVRAKVYNTIANNCVIKQVDSISFAQYNRTTGNFIDSTCYMTITDFTYDNKPDPFWRTYRVFCPDFLTGTTDEWGQPHNLISLSTYTEPYWSSSGSTVIGPGGSYGWSYAYEYKPNGYPQIIRTFGRFNGGDVSKGVCIYGK